MASLLIWALIIHLFFQLSSQMDCKKDLVKNTVINCTFHLNNTMSNLRCDQISDKTYFILHLYRKESNNHTIISLKDFFKSFLSSTFTSNSKIYSCDSKLRDLIAGNPLFLSEYCEKHDDCIQQVSNFINGTYVNSVEIYNIANAEYFEILDQFPLTTEVNIHNNDLVNISDVHIKNLKWLKILTLKTSNIDYLPNEVFDSLQSLEHLDLSQNKIILVTKFSFGKFYRLKILNLSFNSITEISNDAFTGMPNLENIYLMNNKLMTIPDNTFASNKHLKKIDLSNNNVKHLSGQIFDSLQSLEHLDLSQNKIILVTKLSFGKFYKLKILDLSFNSIKEISNDAFTGMPNLENIYLMNNKFTTIPGNMFASNKRLKKIDLSNNNVKHLSGQIFHNLQKLEEVACSRCKLVELDKNLFLNSTKSLKIIDLSKNDIKTVPNGLFQTQPLVASINFSFNKISAIPELRNKTNLRVLQLFQNEILSLDEKLPTEAPAIYYFNISKNKIEVLTDIHVKDFKDLGEFDLSNNNITVVELGLNKDLNIRKLILSNNLIKVFKVNWRQLPYLEELYMDYNQLSHLILPPCIRKSVKRSITFSFKHNRISKLDVNSLKEDENRIKIDRTLAADCFFNGLSKNFVDLSYNPFICDCTLYPFYDYLKSKNRATLDTFLNQKNLTCFGPKFVQNKSIIELPADAFSCSFRTNCPEPCTCGVRGKDNKTFVNCSGTELHKVPQAIPSETTVLYFNRNNLEQLLSLNNNCWDNLTELHVDYNKLTTLEGWKIPQGLRYLSLKGNKIKSLPHTLMNFISNQSTFELLLGGNDKNCNCSRKTLKQFIVEHIAFIKDIDDITCEIDSNGTKSQFPLYTILDEVLCRKKIFVNFDTKFTIISMSIVFVLLLTTLLIYYKQRQLILSYLYIHCDEVFHFCFEENDADDDKVFDAFVAYSSFDRQIVMDILQELEEQEPHFQLCIHERNWLPGRFISDNIISSVQNSKRTIVVLSNNFIASPWFRLELRAAIFKVSGDKKSKIIIILADKSTSLEGIDTELRHVISKRTYLVWGERWFWEKLRYAMPRKSCLDRGEENPVNTDPTKRVSEMALLENI